MLRNPEKNRHRMKCILRFRYLLALAHLKRAILIREVYARDPHIGKPDIAEVIAVRRVFNGDLGEGRENCAGGGFVVRGRLGRRYAVDEGVEVRDFEVFELITEDEGALLGPVEVAEGVELGPVDWNVHFGDVLCFTRP